MKLIFIALAWLAGLLLVLAGTLYWMYRTKRLEVGSKFTLGDIANFVSVLLAIFALAFTLATQYQPDPYIEIAFRQSLDPKAPQIHLQDGAAAEFAMKRGGGRLFLLLRNTGDAPLKHPVYIITAIPVVVRIRCAEEFPQFRPSTEPNICQFNDPQDIDLDSRRKIPYAVGFELVAPPDISQVRLELMLQSENLSILTYVVNIHVSG